MSPFVRKVMMAAHETGCVDRLVLLRSPVAMHQANDAVLKDNPLSKIPTLVLEDGSALFDSDVICAYFDTLHDGPRLLPPQGAPRWQALRWNALGSGLMDALVLMRNERLRPAAGQSQDTLQTYERKLAATLAWLEDQAPVLAATRFGQGHIAVGCALGYLDLRFDDIAWRAVHPALALWCDAFSQRPSAQKTVAHVADRQVP